jgi:prepilin-type processing-associated H-X9-DG protein
MKRKRATRHRLSAFSLLELLVVIAVIMVLLALITSGLSAATAKARQIQCLNNLHEHGIALAHFVSDHHTYPLMMNGPQDGNITINDSNSCWSERIISWEDVLGVYSTRFRLSRLREPSQPLGLWHCPSANPPPTPIFPRNIVFVDYGYNAYGMSKYRDINGSLGLSHRFADFVNYGVPGDPPPFDGDGPVGESAVSAPADMMAIADGFAGGDGVIADGQSCFWRNPRARDFVNSTQRSLRRHRGKANVLFCDGHTASPVLKSLFADTNAVFLVRWNRDHQAHLERLGP